MKFRNQARLCLIAISDVEAQIMFKLNVQLLFYHESIDCFMVMDIT